MAAAKIKASVIHDFYDLKAQVNRHQGEVFDTTKSRMDEINATKLGTLVEPCKEAIETKATTKKG